MNAAGRSWLDARLPWLQQVLRERYGDGVELSRGGDGVDLRFDGFPGRIRIDSAADAFAGTGPDPLPHGSWDAAREGWIAPLGAPLPAPGAAFLPSPLVDAEDDGPRVRYDVLGLAAWMLSRQEEVGRIDLDPHGRFPATASHAHRHGYLERPVVDEWLHVLGQVIARHWPTLPLRIHAGSMRVSHDVDSPSRYAFGGARRLLQTMGGDVLRRGRPLDALRAPLLWLRSGRELSPADPSNTFDWIMDRSEENGLVSAFYFICGRTEPSHDARYDPEDPAIRGLMRRIHARGHEIGLHPSYRTYRDPAALAAEAERLRRVCADEGIRQARWGGRMHFLRWETPTTLRAWDAAGMAYDSTLSYADQPGFRCGTCFEYPAFDPVEERMLALRVRPLVAMECTVMAPRYMGLGCGDAALERFRALKAACYSVGGCFTLLWHNTELETEGKRRLYAALLT